MEVYLPWNNTWLELPALPFIDPGHRMTDTRIISLTSQGSGVPRLYLLGGNYYLSPLEIITTDKVWELVWNGKTNSYNWISQKHHPSLSELYLHLVSSYLSLSRYDFWIRRHSSSSA